MGSEKDETVILENVVLPRRQIQSDGILRKLKHAEELRQLGHNDDALEEYLSLESCLRHSQRSSKEYVCLLECYANIIKLGHDVEKYRNYFMLFANEAYKLRMLSVNEISSIQYRQKPTRRFSLA